MESRDFPRIFGSVQSSRSPGRLEVPHHIDRTSMALLKGMKKKSRRKKNSTGVCYRTAQKSGRHDDTTRSRKILIMTRKAYSEISYPKSKIYFIVAYV
jgi:hypothetical protein